MQLFMLQLLVAAAAIIGSAQAAIATLPIAQEFATSTSTLLNVDSSPAFPQGTDNSNPNRNAGVLNITPCSLSDANNNECLKNLMSKIFPLLKNDIPELGLSAIDPYFYKRGLFRYNNDGIQGGLLLKDMQIHGISDFSINSFDGNFTDKGFVVKISLHSDKLQADGHFKADVKVGGLRLVPKGPFNITMHDLRTTILTDGSFIQTDKGLRVQLKRLNANLSMGDAKIIANGIFSDRNLNAMILNLVNENLREIIRIGMPATREQWAPILIEHINTFFAKVPIEKFLIL